MPTEEEKRSEQDFLKLAIKLLFQRLKEDKVRLAPHLREKLDPGLDSVKFDEEGFPILDTVHPLVMSLAKTTAWSEEERLKKDEKEREEKSAIHGMLLPPVEVSSEVLAKCAKNGQFEPVAFELLKETMSLLVASVNILVAADEPQDFVFSRNQAICAGLLVRIVKFVRAILAILSHGDELGEVVLALLRCIAESAVNVRFLILKNDDALFDQFVKSSFGPEREHYDNIQENIKARGGKVLPIETRMLASIEGICKASGLKVEEVNRKHSDWGGTLRDKLKTLGLEEAYAVIQRIPSHAVHGTWVDLLIHHLEQKPKGFGVWLHDTRVDPRYMVPISLIALSAVRDYVQKFIGDIPEIRPLVSRIDDLEERLRMVDQAHEEWIQQGKKVEPGKPQNPPEQSESAAEKDK